MLKPKILFILHYPPPVVGAAVVGQFIKESSAINTSFEADYINLATASDLRQINKGGLAKIGTFFKIQWKVIKALFAKSYDLCYLSFTAKGLGFYKDLAIVLVLKLFRKSVIYHMHNKGVQPNSKNKFNDFCYQLAFNSAKVILLSPHLYQDIAKYVPADRVFYCPNGIPATPQDSDLSKERQESDTGKILFLSNMTVEKGAYVLLEACKLLKEKGAIFECHFVGDWFDISESDFQRKIALYGLDTCVFAHGKKYGEEKEYFLRSANIFALPTYYHNECFPLVLLEAMKYALPIVSTSEGGIADIVVENETGFIVTQQDAAALEEKLEALINAPKLRSTLGVAGRERYERLYTLDSFEKNITRILKTAVQKD
ncbi:glycosyltransferase family 4 protein [Tunicatimonas pelagia]|uniref:glycosyltransferase family 4 protein n=1 Tax=Tunicatimonas pelagia TaxID=931531 RepID=UPI0026663A62|nr:glycosyltransferase family 4 protein [Tunicatimonas pelagia]WKN40445.1 glycosyltransferase family 4 protein [Tunicatimonas pelagia]